MRGRVVIFGMVLVLGLLPVLSPALGETDEKDQVASLEDASAEKTFPTDLNLVDVGTIKEIRKSDMVILDNRRAYRLSNVRVPLHVEFDAMEYLRKQLMDRKVGIYTEKGSAEAEKDRYGNVYAHVLREDGEWLQAGMVSTGLSWAFSTENTRALAPTLLKYEKMAHNAKLGFWAREDYDIKKKYNIDQFANSYQIFEGRVGPVGARRRGK